jgi:hypothetical protein
MARKSRSHRRVPAVVIDRTPIRRYYHHVTQTSGRLVKQAVLPMRYIRCAFLVEPCAARTHGTVMDC